MTTLDRFKRFCTSDGFRYALGAPFVQQGYLYATDGRVAVRIATDEPEVVNPEFRHPRMDSLPWPDLAQSMMHWPSAAKHKGSIDHIMIGNRKIGIKLARKIRALPGPIRYVSAGHPNDPLQFTAAGKTIEGIIMPMAK